MDEARLGGPCFFRVFPRVAGEALPPQLFGALANALNGCVILRHGLRSIGFLLLARLEKALDAVLLFLLGHANSTHQAVESSGGPDRETLVTGPNDPILSRDRR